MFSQKHSFIVILMSKKFIIRFLRIGLSGFILFILIFELSRCGSPEEEQRSRDERPMRDRSDYDDDDDDSFDGGGEEENLENLDFSGGAGLDTAAGSSPFESNAEEGPAVLKPLNQKGISNKIDIMFVIDSSTTNMRNISHPQLQRHIGILPQSLSSRGIDWQMYFMNSEYDSSSKRKARNGKLLELEYNGGMILAQYLNPSSILSAYNANTQEVFIDTIEHEVVQRRSLGHCSYPPYCMDKRRNRPLSALNNFLGNSQFILREDADFLVVIITNTDEQPIVKRKFFKKSTKKRTTAMDVADSFNTLFPDKKIYAVSIIVKPGDKECLKKTRYSQYASYVPQLSLLTQGIVLSICPAAGSNAFSGPIIQFIEKLKSSAEL